MRTSHRIWVRRTATGALALLVAAAASCKKEESRSEEMVDYSESARPDSTLTTSLERTVDRLDDDDMDLDEGLEAPSEANIQAAAAQVRRDFPAESMAVRDSLTATEAARFASVDPQKVVPAKLLHTALAFFSMHEASFANPRFISVLDYTPSSRAPRFYVVNLGTGAVTTYRMAHGKGSDPDRTGVATLFGNVPDSNRSSLGFVRTAETYQGAHGIALRLDGLSPTNSNLRRRGVVVHGSQYVWDAAVVQGRSKGCPAVPMEQVAPLIEAIKGGSLMYAGRIG